MSVPIMPKSSIVSFHFSKKERIHHQFLIAKLFKGTYVDKYPIRMVYIKSHIFYPGVFIQVPKKKISRATDRNLLKRRLREVYRNNKPPENLKLCMAMVYQGTQVESYEVIKKAWDSLLQKIS